jgi:DNA-binding NtrC family response regulator
VGGLEEIPVRCRVIATCNVSLEEAVDRRVFREDLYYRLEGFKVSLPPLRSRNGDIRLLAEHFLAEVVGAAEDPKQLTQEALEVLRIHAWPGNIRELKNVIQRAVVLAADESEIRVDHLVVKRRTAVRPGAHEPESAREEGDPAAPGLSLRIPEGGCPLSDIEREAVLQTLRATGGNQSEAARRLGISRPRLARMLERHELREVLGLDPRD